MGGGFGPDSRSRICRSSKCGTGLQGSKMIDDNGGGRGSNECMASRGPGGHWEISLSDTLVFPKGERYTSGLAPAALPVQSSSSLHVNCRLAQ